MTTSKTYQMIMAEAKAEEIRLLKQQIELVGHRINMAKEEGKSARELEVQLYRRLRTLEDPTDQAIVDNGGRFTL